MDISGTIALVTGGGSGLGAATAARLAEQGARVVVLDIDDAAAQAVAGQINGYALACDVASGAAAEDALQTVRARFGPVGLLVNCAGIGVARRILGRDGIMPLEDFERVIRINLMGSFNIMRLAAAQMADRQADANGERGVIVLTASVAAFEGQIGQAAYAASKAGIVGLTLPAAREFARFGVRVLTIAPGLFMTPLLGQLPQGVQESLSASIPFPARLGRPEEFAALVHACIANPYLNGEVIRLDGALRMPARS